jgi:TonB-linked SusC/RagA family outer membrane protein
MKCFLTVTKNPLQSKVLLIMKFTALLLLTFTLNVSANGFGQDKISLKMKKTEISGVLHIIEKQTNYRFLYNDNLEDIREKVTINVKEASLDEVLNLLLEKTSLLYQKMENNLVVIKEDPGAAIRIPDVVIRGKVTGEGGLALAGASVQVKGTTTGTSTDNEGNFSITAADANVTLVVSSVGYDAQEVALGGRTEISVTLVTSTKLMDQVVVIGYGTASKRDLTGSIVKISGKDVADKPNTNPVASLQGKVAGLYVVNNGTPGKEPDIRIRGTQSIGQVKPLYIVDGLFQDNIDYINPNDIESIEVLKDPSSLAIFGIRGGTGVIAITTKRAKTGQTTINYNGTYGFKDLVDKLKMASAAEFDVLFDEENANNGVATPDYSALKNRNNTDWIDAVTRKANFQAHNISMSGSSDKNKFNFGVGYISDEGVVIREELKKYLVSFADEYKINSAIKVGLTLNATRLDNPYDAGWVLDAARKVMPHISPDPKTFRVRDLYRSVYDSIDIPIYSGLYLQGSGVVNPVLQVENTWDKTISRENRYVGTFFADVTFLKDFNFRANWYGDVSDVNIRKYNPMYYAYNPISNEPYLYTASSYEAATTSVEQTLNNYKKLQQEYLLTYKKKFGDHSITALGGFTTFLYREELNYSKSTAGGPATALHIPNDPDKWHISNNFGKVLEGDASGSAGEYTTVSWLGRFLYNYRGKYFLNASIRDDASSRIPEKNRHQQFWAVGAAWEASREDFMEGVEFINYLKVKGSVGLLGNQSTYGFAGYYPFYPGIRTGVSEVAVFGTTAYLSATPAYLKNPDLKWETINSYDLGFELVGFDNRLHFEYTYYNKVTKDMMSYINLSSLGLYDILVNGGEVKNWGHEISAGWKQQLGDLTMTIDGNITFMDNKVVSLAKELPNGIIIDARANNGSAEARTMAGQPIGSFFGYVVEGIYQTDLDRLVSPYAGGVGSYFNGDFKFKDVNGDGVVTPEDRTIIGNPSPDFIYGGSVGFNYKNFNLDIDFGGVYGNEVFRVWGALESPFQRVNYPALKTGRWHGPGTSNWEPIISQGHRFNYNGSTYNIEDGSYFRLRNIQLGYDVKSRTLSKAHIKGLRIFVNVQNLKTWKDNNGYTAEFGGSATAFGFDEAGGAIPRVTTFGVNLNF